jgi:hypothetical protein
MEILRHLKKEQDRIKTLERENYALRQSKG